MADRQVLDLTTDTDRPVVAIDGIAYPLRMARDLSLADFKNLERLSIRTADLMTRARSLTKDENRELALRLKEVAKIALDAPPNVLAKLSDVQRVSLFKVFTELLTPTLILAARALATDQAAAAAATHAGARRSRGARQSPGSYAATAGLLDRGSRKRRRG
jgi:hypothetical protein